MTTQEIRKTLLDGLYVPKEIRTNDGRTFLVKSVEHWVIGDGRLVLLTIRNKRRDIDYISLRNIASIGPVSKNRRKQRRRRRA